MTDHDTNGGLDRRGFFKTAGAGLSAAGLVLTGNEAAGAAAAQGGAWTEKDKLARIASCTWPIRSIFKSRAGGGRVRVGARARAQAQAGAQVEAMRRRMRPVRRGLLRGRGGRSGRRRRGQRRRRTAAERERGPDERPDEGEVRRDHHARLPAVHEGQLPRRDAHGLFSGLFGDVTDDSMFARHGSGFDPMSPSGRKWLDQLAANR